MEQTILNFHKQFAWKPTIVNGERLERVSGFVVGGMGGSHLAAGLLAGWRQKTNIIIHRDYGLPALTDEKERLYIASSYSGSTEETIDFAKSALKKGYSVATISIGGKLLEFAKENKLPHIVIPDTHIQPRSALGFSMMALAAFMGGKKLLAELGGLVKKLRPLVFEKKGKALAIKLSHKVPIVYSSNKNSAIAYNWKIKFNETGKIPAFYNVFPELNHNEMTGFDVIKTTEKLSDKFHFIFLTDENDHPQVQKRMQVTWKLYEKRGFPVTQAALSGKTALERIFSSLLTADWTAVHLSKFYGTESEQVPMVEQFKKLIADHR